MKKHIIILLTVSLFIFQSCDSILDLSPEDYYGSGNFWTQESQFDGYIQTLNLELRNLCKTRTIMLGEARGGLYKTSAGSSDGSTHLNGEILTSALSADVPGVTNFAGYYSAITQTNLFLKRTLETAVLSDSKKDFYLGIAYGLRAFLYFDLYRTYGGVPLRTDIKVIEGETDPTKLYLARSTPDQVFDQICSDINSSLEKFGSVKDFDPYDNGAKVTWSKAATEYLAGEVYLWNAKVSVSDRSSTHSANPADIDKARTYFENVTGGYGLELDDRFGHIFSTSEKCGSEVIFAIRYLENECNNPIGLNYTYMSDGRGALANLYDSLGNAFGDPLQLNSSGGAQWYEYKNALWESFDASDSRRDATFIPCYEKDGHDSLILFSTPLKKNMGHVNASGVHVFDGDQIYFRLAGAYLALAEIANFTDPSSPDVAKYINVIRRRAYGSAWDETAYGYVNTGDFKANELAILAEYDKEFVNEGRRWWDLCRMTAVRGGAVTDHLAFCPEANPSDDSAIQNTPVLSPSQAYKLLWPVDKTVIGNDPSIEQTVGY